MYEETPLRAAQKSLKLFKIISGQLQLPEEFQVGKCMVGMMFSLLTGRSEEQASPQRRALEIKLLTHC